MIDNIINMVLNTNMTLNHPELPDNNQTPESAKMPEPVSDVPTKAREILEQTKDRQKLNALREQGQLSPHDYDLNELAMLQEAGASLTKKDLGNQALVLSRSEFEQFSYIDVVLNNGEDIRIDADSMKDSEFILFPDDLS